MHIYDAHFASDPDQDLKLIKMIIFDLFLQM